MDQPNKRSSHKQVVIRGGGIIFYLGALFFFVTNQFRYPWFLLGLTMVTTISFWDDIRSVSQNVRLSIHFIALSLMVYQWGLFLLSWWTILVILIVCVGIINAYNFMDGINGITSGYSFVVLLSLAYINQTVTPFVEQDLILTILSAVTVFCFFNFRPHAKCFVGDVGSVSIAFIILFLIGLLIIKTNNFSWIILLSVYGVDSVLTIAHRIILHENISHSHRMHLYQIMANELKIPHIIVSAVYIGIQGIIIIGYLQLQDFGYWYLTSCVVVLSIAYVVFMRKYFNLHIY